jgi:hypothetical protein
MHTTDELIEYTKRLYLELFALHEMGIANGHSYYKKRYEAILSAHVYQERQRVKELQLEQAKEYLYE